MTKDKRFCLYQHVQGNIIAAWVMGTGCSYPRIKQMEHEAGQSCTPSTKAEKVWNQKSAFLFTFIA
jgi:hypothetical protein